jgi:hypothetical protein
MLEPVVYLPSSKNWTGRLTASGQDFYSKLSIHYPGSGRRWYLMELLYPFPGPSKVKGGLRGFINLIEFRSRVIRILRKQHRPVEIREQFVIYLKLSDGCGS